MGDDVIALRWHFTCFIMQNPQIKKKTSPNYKQVPMITLD